MTPEKQRIKIAEACGWSGFRTRTYSDDGSQALTGYKGGKWGDVPDYLNDLNAMHEAWLQLDEAQRFQFRAELANIAEREAIWAEEAQASFGTEAFLRTIGMWEEET